MKEEIYTFLNNYKDEKYSSFNAKLIKDNLKIIGVKLPLLLDFAISHVKNVDAILEVPDDGIFEIVMIKLLTVSQVKEVEIYKKYFNMCIELISNWSLCDSFVMHSKVIKKDRPYFFNRAKELIKDNDEFHKRIGLIILLGYFITDDYIDELFDIMSSCKTNGYYSEMALAWLISFVFIKYPQDTKGFLLKCNIDKSIIKQTIRKIKDSYRVSDIDKKWLDNIKK